MSVDKPNERYFRMTAFLFALLLAMSVSGYGAGISTYPHDPTQADPREVALLPRYCPYTLVFRERVPGFNQSEADRWASLIGKTFIHLHHYCFGLIRTNRALILAHGDRKFNLEDSILEFDYVIHRAPADFILLPEILTKKGENLLHLDKAGEGVAALVRAIELRPDYWPPYAVLSDYFKKVKSISTARQWIEKGLLATPDSKPLQQRLRELGAIGGENSGAQSR